MRYCLALASALHIDPAERELMRKGALLHDIGKISIPDAILDKPGKLTAEEYEIVKAHTGQGAHIVEPLLSVRDAIPLIRSHHERLDGKGYPDGLRGDEIPMLVRILSVCDIYDSLASHRPYRDAIPHPLCLEMLRETAFDGGLDPEIVAVFCNIVTPLPPERADKTAGSFIKPRSSHDLLPQDGV
jgi:putative two-component system response regulator